MSMPMTMRQRSYRATRRMGMGMDLGMDMAIGMTIGNRDPYRPLPSLIPHTPPCG